MLMNRKAKTVNVLEGPITESCAEFPARHVFIKCPECRRVIDEVRLHDNLEVCPRCGKHFRVSGRARMLMTVDEGTFEEWDANLASEDFLSFPGYADKLKSAGERSGERDAVVCGRGKICGCDTALFFMDANFMMGSMGSVVGEKICRSFERATELGLPVVGFTVSGGARMQEGVTSLMQMAKISAAVRRHSEAGGLYITVLTDPTTGGVTASFAMEGDIILAEPDALTAFAGPRVIEQHMHKRLPNGVQRSEFLREHGVCDAVVPRGEIALAVGELLAWVKEDENRRKGEMVLIVEGHKAEEDALPADALRTLALLQAELPLKKAAALAAEIHGVKKNALYKSALEQQGE